MTTPACPRCGSTSLEVVFGLPGMELFEAADRGEVVLGGCSIIDGEDEQFECAGIDCGIRFPASVVDNR